MRKNLFLSFTGFLSLTLSSCKNSAAPKTIVVDTSPEVTEVVFEKSQKMSMEIGGMVCAMGCAAVIEKNLNNTKGIIAAKVDFETQKATLIFDAASLTPTQVTEVVLNTGEAYAVNSFELLD